MICRAGPDAQVAPVVGDLDLDRVGSSWRGMIKMVRDNDDGEGGADANSRAVGDLRMGAGGQPAVWRNVSPPLRPYKGNAGH